MYTVSTIIIAYQFLLLLTLKWSLTIAHVMRSVAFVYFVHAICYIYTLEEGNITVPV